MAHGCFNRKEFVDQYPVLAVSANGDGYVQAEVPFRLSRHCQYTKTVLGQTDKGCVGCKHREDVQPTDTDTDTHTSAPSGLPGNLKLQLANITRQPQRQDSDLAQLRDLGAFANKLGLYDAADLIRILTRNLRSTG